jgi:hypothetical protein
LVQERYDWKAIGITMLQVYEWMLGRGSKPACIIDC